MTEVRIFESKKTLEVTKTYATMLLITLFQVLYTSDAVCFDTSWAMAARRVSCSASDSGDIFSRLTSHTSG